MLCALIIVDRACFFKENSYFVTIYYKKTYLIALIVVLPEHDIACLAQQMYILCTKISVYTSKQYIFFGSIVNLY